MYNYKSIQELIVKAAICDRVSTTISAEEVAPGVDVLKFTFSKGGKDSSMYIDLLQIDEPGVLYGCKSTLYKLLRAPYEDIKYTKEK